MRHDLASPLKPDSPILAHHFLYVSNLLSMVRLALVPFLFSSILQGELLLTAVLGSLAILTDALDGYFARRLNQHSSLGKLLDPIADKTAIGAAILALVLSDREFPRWAFGVLVVRDVLIVAGNFLLFRKTQIIVRSNLWGKATTVCLSAALMLYVLRDTLPTMFRALAFYLLCLGLILAILSLWNYGLRLFNLHRAHELQQQKQ